MTIKRFLTLAAGLAASIALAAAASACGYGVMGDGMSDMMDRDMGAGTAEAAANRAGFSIPPLAILTREFARTHG